MAGVHETPCLTAYRSANDPPDDGSIQLNTADPSGATDQFGCRLPGPDGFTSEVDVKVWLNAGSAYRTLISIDWIFTRRAPLLADHESVAISNRKMIGCPIPSSLEVLAN